MTNSPPSSSRGANAATAAALCAVALAGAAALWQATLGFRVVSTEDGRRLQISEHPLSLPRTELTGPSGELTANLRADGRVAIVTFFYSQCVAVCSSLGSQYQQLQDAIVARGAGAQVRLVSLSFDGRDDAAALRHYSASQHADSRIWTLAAMPQAAQRRALLDAAGIVVLPAPLGEFAHNAAFHVVDRSGRLLRVFDLEQQQAALEYALALARQARS